MRREDIHRERCRRQRRSRVRDPAIGAGCCDERIAGAASSTSARRDRINCPRWIRTTILGSKDRCPAIGRGGRRGKASRPSQAEQRFRAVSRDRSTMFHLACAGTESHIRLQKRAGLPVNSEDPCERCAWVERRHCSSLPGCLSFASPVERACAQGQQPSLGTVAGFAVDSVRGGPLRGATVSILGTALSAITDSSGQFRIDGVRAGPVSLVLAHPLIDTLGISIVSPSRAASGRRGPRVCVGHPVSTDDRVEEVLSR